MSGTWTGTAGSRWSVVDDYPDTGGTDQLTHGTTAGTLTFAFSTAFTIPATATNIQVFVDYYDRKSASQSCSFGGRLKVGASYFNASTHNPAQTLTQRTDTWATNPAGGAWTPAQINGTAGSNNLAGFGVNSGSDASPTILLSSIRLRVTYENNYTLVAATGAFTLAGSNATMRVALPAEAGVFALTGNDATLTGGGVDAVLTADPGSFTLTGNAAVVSVQRKVVAALGTFALAGTTTGLRVSMPASVGAFALAGSAAALRAQRRVTAALGTFALTGAAASLRVAMPAGVGAFALTGVAAILRAQRILSAAVGSFALAGVAVGFSRTRRLVTSAGAFALTGNAAALTYVGAESYTLVAGTGVFTLTGQAAGLTAGRRLTASVGEFDLSGAEASLRVSMPASIGAFVLTGTVAGLRSARLLVAPPGAFSLTGNSAALATSKRLSAETGVFSLSGAPSVLRHGYMMAVSPGAFALSGSVVTFDRFRGLVAETGVFVLTGNPAILGLALAGFAELQLSPVVPSTELIASVARLTNLLSRVLVMPLHVGDTAEVDVTVKPRSSGTLTDPTAISIRVTAPDGTVTTFAYGTDSNVTKVSTGKFRAALDCTASGRWHFTWVSPGPIAKGSEPGHFDVEPVS